MSDPVKLVFEGDENLEQIFKQLPKQYSKKVMTAIYRKAAVPLNREVRRRLPGSLKKTVGTVSGRSRTNPTMYAGILIKRRSPDTWFKTYWKAYGTLANRDRSHDFSYDRKNKSADYKGGIKPDKSIQEAVGKNIDKSRQIITKQAANVANKCMSKYAKVKGRES